MVDLLVTLVKVAPLSTGFASAVGRGRPDRNQGYHVSSASPVPVLGSKSQTLL